MGDVLSQHCTNVICNVCHTCLKFYVTFCMTLICVIDISDYLLHGECEVGNCIDVRRYVDLVANTHLIIIMVIMVNMVMIVNMMMVTLSNTNNSPWLNPNASRGGKSCHWSCGWRWRASPTCCTSPHPPPSRPCSHPGQD